MRALTRDIQRATSPAWLEITRTALIARVNYYCSWRFTVLSEQTVAQLDMLEKRIKELTE